MSKVIPAEKIEFPFFLFSSLLYFSFLRQLFSPFTLHLGSTDEKLYSPLFCTTRDPRASDLHYVDFNEWKSSSNWDSMRQIGDPKSELRGTMHKFRRTDTNHSAGSRRLNRKTFHCKGKKTTPKTEAGIAQFGSKLSGWSASPTLNHCCAELLKRQTKIQIREEEKKSKEHRNQLKI